LLSEAGYETRWQGNVSLNDETIDYSRRAIQLIEGGQSFKTGAIQESGDAALVSSTMLWFPSEGQVADGRSRRLFKGRPHQKHLRNDPLITTVLAWQFSKGKYAQLSIEYNEKYGAKQSSAEQQAAFEQNPAFRAREQSTPLLARSP